MTDEEIIAQALRHFAEDEEWERSIREEYREDMRFRAGKQWPAARERERRAANRPVHVHNRLPTYISSVTNEVRQNKPSVSFTPVEEADTETAKILRGMARHIQYDSGASMAYETAMDCSVTGSFGAFRMVSQYCKEQGQRFKQELKILEIVDPLCVYGVLRPAIMREKCRHAFVVTTMSREDYRRQYGESADFTSFAESNTTGWVTRDEVRIAEYWWVETKKVKLAQLEDGTELEWDLLPQEAMDAGIVKDTRYDDEDTVHWCKMNGAEILPDTKTEWVGSSIPIYAVLAAQTVVDGVAELYSLIRFMRSPSQLINYGKSRIAEVLQMVPISPFIGVEGQFAGHEHEWAAANVQPMPYLEYAPVTIDGKPAARPERNVYEPPIVALSAFVAQEVDELKAITGIFDPSLGDKSNETSGRAILARQQQSTSTNMHFQNNLKYAHEQCGRDLAEAIPKIYDTNRVVRILGEDETSKWVKINEPVEDEVKNDVAHSAGRYDVAVSFGRAYNSKRLETFDAMSTMAQADPGFLPKFGDIVFANSDLAGADRIAERYKRMLPPGLSEEGEDQEIKIPPQVQARVQATEQQNEQLVAALNQMTDAVAAKRMEYESRERIEMIRQQAESIRTLAKLESAENVELLRQEIAALGRKIEESRPAEGPEEGR